MTNLNPAQIQNILTQVNIMVSELYLLRQRVAELELEKRNLVAALEEARKEITQGESPDKPLEGERND